MYDFATNLIWSYVSVMRMICDIKQGSRVLVVAIGGGGDIVSAASFSLVLEDLGVRAVLASIAWERFVNDPTPGPIELDGIDNIVYRGEGYAIINRDSYATRGGRKILFQAARVAKALNREIYIIDMYGGVRGFHRALLEIMNRENIDIVVGFDVGGDSLATGCEENLWSPLADWIGVGALSLVDGILGVHSPGSDGELAQEYVLSRIDELSRKGALVGVKTICRREAEVLETLLKNIQTEASMIPLMAYRGLRGRFSIRKGSRFVNITMFNALTFFLKARQVVEGTEIIRKILNTESLQEARGILNSYGIYTELDLEEDLSRLRIKPDQLTSDIMRETRRRGRERLGGVRRDLLYCRDSGDQHSC